MKIARKNILIRQFGRGGSCSTNKKADTSAKRTCESKIPTTKQNEIMNKQSYDSSAENFLEMATNRQKVIVLNLTST